MYVIESPCSEMKLQIHVQEFINSSVLVHKAPLAVWPDPGVVDLELHDWCEDQVLQFAVRLLEMVSNCLFLILN